MKKNYVILITMSLVSALLAGIVTIFTILETGAFMMMAAGDGTTCTVSDNLHVEGAVWGQEDIKVKGEKVLTNCIVKESNWSAEEEFNSSISVACSSAEGEVRVGGGGHCEGTKTGEKHLAYIKESRPYLNYTWRVTCSMPTETWSGQTIKAKAYVICCKQD